MVRVSMSDGVLNPFRCFGLDVVVDIDLKILDELYQQRMHIVHPDMNASMPEYDKLRSLQQSSQINDAYRTLKSPTLRFRSILELNGVVFDLDRHTHLSPSFLIQQMEWQEQLDDAKSSQSVEQIESLLSKIDDLILEYQKRIRDQLTKKQYAEATLDWYRLYFLEKFASNVQETLRYLIDF